MGRFFQALRGLFAGDGGFTLPEGFVPQSLVPSPDGTHLAYLTRSSRGGPQVEIDGTCVQRVEGVGGLTFSPDSQRAAFGMAQAGQWFVVFGQSVYGPYRDIGQTSPVISPDSTSVAYSAQVGPAWYVFRDGEQVGGPYEALCPGGVVFSPDSRRLGYVTKETAGWAVVVDGTVLRRHRGVVERSWRFTPNSQDLAYVALVEGTVDPNGSAGKQAVVVGSNVHLSWPHDSARRWGISDEIAFSPDGGRMAYSVRDARGCFFVVDAEPGRPYEGFISGHPGDLPGAVFPVARRAAFRRDVLTFSPDSRHYAFGAADLAAPRHVLVYDGDEADAHPSLLNAPVLFSPDSRRIAYGAGEGSEQYLVLDMTPMRGYYGLVTEAARFSPDSRHVAYLAMPGQRSYAVAIDARDWPLIDGPIAGAGLVWESNSAVRILAARGRRVCPLRYSAAEHG